MGFLGLLVVCGLALFAQAATITDADLKKNDIAVLNYALTLEHLEATFYNTYQAQFDSNDFVSAGLTSQDYDYFNLIADHENTHVSVLTQVITSLGGTPVAACTYAFGVTDVPSYIATARLLENTGVMAYDGALNHVHARSLQQAAATIATIEARHAEYLNGLSGQIPFPASFDTPMTPQQIVNKVSKIITECPPSNGKLQVPVIAQIPFDKAIITFYNKTVIQPGIKSKVTGNDIRALKYALLLEHLEMAFYTQFHNAFNAKDFTDAGLPSDAYPYIGLILKHETAHATALTAALKSVGEMPYPLCAYNFGDLKTVSDYLALAVTIENTGVTAYDGAAHTITNPGYLQFAATVATVEARQAAYLNMLAEYVPFPAAFDTPVSPNKIAEAVAAFQTCEFTIDLPDILYITSKVKND